MKVWRKRVINDWVRVSARSNRQVASILETTLVIVRLTNPVLKKVRVWKNNQYMVLIEWVSTNQNQQALAILVIFHSYSNLMESLTKKKHNVKCASSNFDLALRAVRQILMYLTLTYDQNFISVFRDLSEIIVLNMNTLDWKQWKRNMCCDPHTGFKNVTLTFDSKVISVIWNLYNNLHTMSNHCVEYELPLPTKKRNGSSCYNPQSKYWQILCLLGIDL